MAVVVSLYLDLKRQKKLELVTMIYLYIDTEFSFTIWQVISSQFQKLLLIVLIKQVSPTKRPKQILKTVRKVEVLLPLNICIIDAYSHN